ncbi:hypothetical protein C7U92_07000 [Bradyrhizobium sp. WBOS7]|uniref:Uncharacterized protein n=1 Tax=Bradyrhizobium betae TaxID=244734 RepID=A0AAE9SX63_9BRAD|nr:MULTISPECIES: hypothetical protein [Bradyrhizobium]MDD1569365.1 hypothetical protein [Bradyrhizobium sp. WBOS1]UUO38156.1 hypothetical protein DCK84_28610 [Bradyrhizobium sp. WBOS01]MDD1529838.1 hypothetical protein [Bradyrhizobium sp. WBOS2]MDD1576484.1 hypothetical protein [Bradyrhizobium sp. WBOS7]MDD1602325.1 hypothetical protein [Bradyrhizobium sp. WBOS16]
MMGRNFETVVPRESVVAVVPRQLISAAIAFLQPASSAKCVEKLSLSAWLFLTSVFWAVVRSSFIVKSVSGETLDQTIPLWIRVAFFAAFAIPSIFFFAFRKDRFWLLGLGSVVGLMPELPLIPYIRDNGHLLVILSAIAALLYGMMFPLEKAPGFARTYALYVTVCAASTIINFLLYQNVWQLKVGISFLIFFTALAVMISGVSRAGNSRWSTVEGLVEGLSWGAIGQCAIAIVSLPLLFILPFEDGADTVFGLAFYDRYKSTMPGPVNLGMFFVAAMPLVLLWMSWGNSKIRACLGWVYLQMAPWLVGMTGSRTARIVLIGLVLAFLLKPKTRLSALIILPSIAISFYLSFYFESFPAAVRSALGDASAATLSLKGNFFYMSDRSGLIEAAVEALPVFGRNALSLAKSLHSSEAGASFYIPPLAPMLPASVLEALNLFFGYGAGVGGYVRSGYPSPHTTILNLLIDTGVFGLISCVTFFVWLALRLFVRSFSRAHPHAITIWLCLLCYGAASVANGTYVPQWWGYYSVILVLAAAAAANSLTEGSAERQSRDV